VGQPVVQSGPVRQAGKRIEQGHPDQLKLRVVVFSIIVDQCDRSTHLAVGVAKRCAAHVQMAEIPVGKSDIEVVAVRQPAAPPRQRVAGNLPPRRVEALQ
jgi:hypothetical protein